MSDGPGLSETLKIAIFAACLEATEEVLCRQFRL